MTKVLLQYGSPAPDGTYPPVEGVLIWTPTRRRVIAGSPDKMIMPIGFKVPITGGVIEVNVAPNGIDWVWRVDELVKGASRVISYKAVPEAEEVEFTELVNIDPTSLTPIATPEPIWYSWVEGLALSAGNAEADAEASKLAAIESQTSALSSANIATAKATEASNSAATSADKATQAGTHAFNAGTSAATALGHKNDSEASKVAAASSESNALLYRNQTQISRDAAETAQGITEVFKNETFIARDEAVNANNATVTTGAVDGNGHLILTRTDTTPIDAGYVIGPPINLEVTDINTGPAPETIVGPTGPIGPKGDPGGWASSVIANGTNFDTIITSGLYLNPSANASASPSNTLGYGGHLEVIASSGWIMQRYTNIFEIRETYVRYRNSSGTWGAWRSHNTTRIDQTAGRVMYIWDELNNRDQLVYGDTGWRSIANDATYGLTAAGNFFGAVNGGVVGDSLLQLRRIDMTCYLVGGPIQPKQDFSNSANKLCILPPGFRAERDGQHTTMRYGNNTNDASQRLVSLVPGASWSNPATVAVTPLIDSNWNNYATGGTWPRSLGGIWVHAIWTTADAWPTTLPGIASGSIPNA